ncbi:hypothetical protein EVAR_42538_1 [Eumeta japonica]|uniref:Uncharacterized protein n=1 Tax=Eumeta variegata TaxID=151549 RepID=A0A4C1WSK7_EUMVA|nr:hypothetical protein EVAR_42538_1 [Eumeta japonica]
MYYDRISVAKVNRNRKLETEPVDAAFQFGDFILFRENIKMAFRIPSDHILIACARNRGTFTLLRWATEPSGRVPGLTVSMPSRQIQVISTLRCRDSETQYRRLVRGLTS